MVSTSEQMQVPNGTGPGVLCWLAAPVAMFYENLPKFGNKVKIGNKVQFGARFSNWCNVWSVKGVTVDDHVPECHVTFERGGFRHNHSVYQNHSVNQNHSVYAMKATTTSRPWQRDVAT